MIKRILDSLTCAIAGAAIVLAIFCPHLDVKIFFVAAGACMFILAMWPTCDMKKNLDHRCGHELFADEEIAAQAVEDEEAQCLDALEREKLAGSCHPKVD